MELRLNDENIGRFLQEYDRSEKAIVLNNIHIYNIPPELKQLNNLEEINLENTKISRVENLPMFTQSLCLSDNNIERIKKDEIPKSVKILDLSYNLLREVDLDDGLEELNISGNESIDTIVIPESVEVFIATDCQFDDIFIFSKLNFSTSLRVLNLSDNFISSVAYLPDTIEDLNLDNNKISEINVSRMSNLRVLNLANNIIASIEGIPHSLEEINLSDNVISEFPELPVGIVKVNLSGNQIQKIKNSELENLTALEELRLDNNPIIKMPSIIDKMDLKICVVNFEESEDEERFSHPDLINAVD